MDLRGRLRGGENLSKRRDGVTDPGGLGLFPNFGWAWPNNMRVLYNRASLRSRRQAVRELEAHRLVGREGREVAGYDLPDVPVLTDGPKTRNGQRAFHMNAEGVGRLFAAVYSDPDPKETDEPRDTSYVPKDGPLPEMYEPVESPVGEPPAPEGAPQPAAQVPARPVAPADRHREGFPYVLMTSTLAEHWCAGSTTRNIPWLNELIPEPTCEIP
jgi:formate dehydrogenase major subunit